MNISRKRTCSSPLPPREKRVKKSLRREDYTLGWLCVLDSEIAAATATFDIEYEASRLPVGDDNHYQFGKIGKHNVVVACLSAGDKGTTAAATVASRLYDSFPSIAQYGQLLLVGIGGGIPGEQNDVRLGDVVVSVPRGNYGGVVQYDLGKALRDGHLEPDNHLNRVPKFWLSAVNQLKAKHSTCNYYLKQFLPEAERKALALSFPGRQHDRSFSAQYHHLSSSVSGCTECDPTQLIKRTAREDDSPVIHYGTIASGNQVIKDGQTRDRIGNKCGATCFEMEAAGLMNDFPCLVIRGVCDYADSHKNDKWQKYAASAAAAYAKALLNTITEREYTDAHSTSESESSIQGYSGDLSAEADFYRVHDDSCATSYSKTNGFRAKDQETFFKMFTPRDDDEEEESFDILTSHLDWGSRQPSPLISTFSDKATALYHAKARAVEGKSGVLVAAIDRSKRPGGVWYRPARELADEVELWIERKAWKHSEYETVFFRRIPACMIVDVKRIN